ncbi:DUF397 domain-containing protein [Embleya sp. NPDC059259]|uniref:DUF397 domain-containing protein n=1 Tax=unclassified Embleya TaxID=2699296 RepID=UPI003687EF22
MNDTSPAADYIASLAWRTASGSSDQGACVEVAPLTNGVAVRDSKDRALGIHRYPRGGWAALLDAVRCGHPSI